MGSRWPRARVIVTVSAASSDRGSRESETIVGVFKLRRNARAGGGAADLDVMPPGTTS